MPRVARIGDPISHGGTIVSGSEDVFTNGLGQARETDQVICSIHGPQTIISGSSDVIVNGLQIARLGDPVSCGAVIVDDVSPDTVANEEGSTTMETSSMA